MITLILSSYYDCFVIWGKDAICGRRGIWRKYDLISYIDDNNLYLSIDGSNSYIAYLYKFQNL